MRAARNAVSGCVALAFAAGSTFAQETVPFSAALELPAHQSFISQSRDKGLSDFETDGCSGGMSAIWSSVAERFPDLLANYGQVPPWESCCVTHDRAYHDAAGAITPRASQVARLTADQVLQACVSARNYLEAEDAANMPGIDAETVAAAYQALANAMYAAVRLGGAPCSGLSWRWGYGYPHCSVLLQPFQD